jgi:hypothetical protein
MSCCGSNAPRYNRRADSFDLCVGGWAAGWNESRGVHCLLDTGLRNQEEAVKYGIVIFATDFAIRPDELAKAVEDRGFESLIFPEHTHIPASHRTPYPLGGELPKEYSHTLDPLVAMTVFESRRSGRALFKVSRASKHRAI